MRMLIVSFLASLCVLCLLAPAAAQQGGAREQTFRLYDGITLYVDNPQGRQFTLDLAVRDLNLLANGPRELLFKVYDPDGRPVVREIIPDDGVTTGNFSERIGGWDHELQYYAALHERGFHPSSRWSAWSDPARLKTIVARTFSRQIAGKPGIYRVVLAGNPDHYVSIRLSPDLATAVAGHPNWIHGHGSLFKKAYIYVPRGATGLSMAIAEPDVPQSRRFTITAPDGKVLFDGTAAGSYRHPKDKPWQEATIGFRQGAYDGKLLALEVSDGPNDYLIRLTMRQGRPNVKLADGPGTDGMGMTALLAPDTATADALRGGAIIVDDQIFWHPFQVRFHQWLKANPLEGHPAQEELVTLFKHFRRLEVSDGAGAFGWANWAYGMGYYGCHIFRPSWVLLRRDDVPAELKAILREGIIMGGDRLYFATNAERCNGNAFAQINVALWYAHRATGDPIQKELFETFWQRWSTEGWGKGVGLSPSGDAQEHFSHDAHYGSYIMDNWHATKNEWVRGAGILRDATDDPRFQQVMNRYYDLYSYLYCREQDKRPVAANPWSTRTANHPHRQAENWEGMNGVRWKGEPGPDFTVNVNNGSEWFAAHRKSYYMLTFHGRVAPAWMSRCFEGQLGFSGGIICQLTVPGKGPVLVSTLTGSYGKGMDPSNWRNMNIHTLVAERWDGVPVLGGISEHDDARLEGNTVTSSGEVRDGRVKVARSYTYHPDSIDCTVSLSTSDLASILSIWAHERLWSEVKTASEMLAFMPGCTVTLLDAEGTEIGAATATPTEASRVRIDRRGYGVVVELPRPLKVSLGGRHNVIIQIIEEGEKPVPAESVSLQYRLIPYGG